MATYRWAKWNGGIPAQAAGERLTILASENNERLTPRAVVEDARPIDAVLHPCFEWDDLRAAELFREDQARAVIRGIRVVTQEQTEKLPEEIERVFVNIIESIGEDIEHSYIPVPVARGNPDLQRQVIAAARRDFMAWRSRYLDLARIIGADAIVEKFNQLEPSTSDSDQHTTA